MTTGSAESGTGPGPAYTRFQVGALVALRLLIGWHFFYEGLAKLTNPYWTSAGYLADSQWFLRGTLTKIAASPTAVTVVDYLNEWGLLLIGLGLIFGLLTRFASITAVVLLCLYYLAAPPLVGYSYAMPSEGSYLVVNKILIELVALLVLLAFPAGREYSLDGLLSRRRARRAAARAEA
jgi:thiosulfate dehydrogenase (quinone) large subunit